jgi:phenylacetate-CoA ligase
MAGGLHHSRAAIATGQLEQLRALLTELIPGNSFYTRKLHAVGVTFDVSSLEDFSRRFPFTIKTELADDQRANPPFGTDLTYPLDRYTRMHQTSGTSGSPLRWFDTPESWSGLVESWVEIFEAAGVTASDRVYFAFSFGPFIGFWLAFEAASRMGALCIPGGGMSSAARLRAIIDNQATVLCCTPTYSLRLAEVAATEKIDLRASKVRTLVVAGEPGGSIPAVRARIEQSWAPARVFDHHGMTETGPVTYECPAHPGILHVMESAYFAEIIEPGGTKAVPPGQPGELVLTTLGRIGSPLLRYRTGDLAKAVTTPCGCGRQELALDGGILGRTDDMIFVRGVNIYPTAGEEIIRAAGEVLEFRVRVSTKQALAELSVEIEAAPGCGDVAALAVRLEKEFQRQFALRVPVTAVKELPRFEMKAKRWVRE